MQCLRFVLCDIPMALALAFFPLAFNPNPAAAKEPPSDTCSLLTPQQLQKTMGQPFGTPQENPAPAVYAGQADGKNCHYTGQKSDTQQVFLIVYVDKSPTEAKQTFDKLAAYSPAESKPSGIGDSAYMDKRHVIHVLKSKVRYFINVDSSDSDAAREKQEQALAISIAAQL